MSHPTAAIDQVERQLLGGLDPGSPWLLVFEQAGMAVAVLDADFGFLRVNHLYAAASGRTPDFFIGRRYFDLYPQAEIETLFRRVRATGVAYSHTAQSFLTNLSPMPGLGQWNWSLTPFGADDTPVTEMSRFLVLTMQDVSTRLNAEAHARRGEASLQVLLGQLPGMVYRGNADWSADTLFNGEALTGYTAAEINALPDHWLGLVHPDDRPAVLAESERLHRGRRQARISYRIVDKAGATRWVDDRKTALFADSGDFLGVEGIVFDITERKAQDETLRINEQRYRDLIKTSIDGYLMTDRNGKLLDVNDAYCQISGYTRDELLQLSIEQIEVLDNPHEISGHSANTAGSGGKRFETRHRRKDGSTWLVEVSTSYSPESGGRIFAFLRDIHQRRNTETQLATRLKLVEMAAETSIDELLRTALDAAEVLTDSTIGFFHLVDADQEMLNLTAWSTHTLETMCTAEGKGSHYPIRHAGVWADCVRQRRAIIHNDYPHLENRAGLPTGHAPIRRDLTVPILLDGQVVAVIGVGNKAEDYSQEDIVAVAQLAELAIDIVARKRSELALRDSEKRSRRLFESMTSGFALHEIVLDADGTPCDYRFLDVNPAFEAITGFARADILGRRAREVMPQIEARWIERYGIVALTGDSNQFDDFSTDLQRHYRVIAYRPEPGQFAVILDDVTAIKRNEESLRQAATVFENIHDGVTITDAHGTIVAVNRAFTEITGYTNEEAVGRNPSILKSGRHDACFYATIWGALATHRFWQGEIWNRRKNGEVYPEWLTISAIANECGETDRYIGVFTDISRVKDAEERADFIAYHDSLTGLPNRTLLVARYQQAGERAERRGHKLALLILDLDLFKNINDSLGHDFGDRLLVAITERFKSRLRGEDTLARLGGDEFAVLMEEIDDAADAAILARGLLETFDAPFRIEDSEDIYISASVGISVSPDDGKDLTMLMRNADAAVYLAKAQGRKTFRFYTESLTTLALERISMESRLRKAIELDHLILHYQPIIDACSGSVIGSEALVRWQDPEQGLIPPMRFIPVAEDSGLIAPLGTWVLTAACRQMKSWREAGRSLQTVAVNLSPRQFALQNVPELVRNTLAETGLEARFLELEITESILMEHGEGAIAVLNQLRALGVRLSIDDFGTGYSSLAYLKRFPIDKLKIDQSFIRDITTDSSDAEIVSMIIAMGRSLKLSVLAEGVETPAQLAFLENHGCDYYQGYLFSRPVPAEQFPEYCPVARLAIES